MCFDSSYLQYEEAVANPELFLGEGKQKLIFDKF